MGNIKRIADPVHGTIALSELEGALISTRAYQRLRGVKHLGLASLVFPGADYSRFAHGVGTCHVTGLILDSLRRIDQSTVTDSDARLYRAAALLHDLGHYPFSHTFERALKNHYSNTEILKPKGEPEPSQGSAAAPPLPGNWMHEELGTRVITEDPEITPLLQTADIDVEVLTRTIVRADPPKFANLVSSDLDADRVDYLMRTATHTGLPYGRVDLPYLLSQIRVDSGKNICFTTKGMRAAEHLLLSRYFDYQQVSYHKTVAGLEEVLNDAVGCLLQLGLLKCRPADLQGMIADGSWYHFDDSQITALMRQAVGSSGDETQQLLFKSILERRPPKVVADREVLGPATHSTIFKSLEKSAIQCRTKWANDFGCPFYVWSKLGTSLTKIGPQIPIQDDGIEDETWDKVQQAVHILRKNGTSVPIQQHPRSLMSVLSEHALYSLRVYALLPPDREPERAEIEARVNQDLGDYYLES